MKAFIGGCDDQFGTKLQLRIAPIKKLMEQLILSDAFFCFVTHFKSCDMKNDQKLLRNIPIKRGD